MVEERIQVNQEIVGDVNKKIQLSCTQSLASTLGDEGAKELLIIKALKKDID